MKRISKIKKFSQIIFLFVYIFSIKDPEDLYKKGKILTSFFFVFLEYSLNFSKIPMYVHVLCFN